MSDLISRQAAIDAIRRLPNAGIRWFVSAEAVFDSLLSLPIAQPELKRGKWIDVDVMGMPAQACDQCNTFFPLAYTGGGHHYCPNCGAKMEVTE